MIPLLLTHIRTSDGVRLEGVAVLPKRKGNTALIWIHGFSSRFSSGQTLINELSTRCAQNGIAYLKFNTRGHDIAAPGGKGGETAGAGFEKFEECILDIRAMIQFARKLGYTKIILTGSSTGANKALYYIYKTKDRRVRGLILRGAVSDASVGIQEYGTKKLSRGLAVARRLAMKKPLALMPLEFGFYSPRRFLSLFSPGSPENVFPSHNPKASWKELKSVKIPIAVILGSRDQYLDRPAKKLISIFQKNTISTKSFSGIIIKGARHGFQKHERELADIIVNWIKTNQ